MKQEKGTKRSNKVIGGDVCRKTIRQTEISEISRRLKTMARD
ncbi:DnaB-like helicase C-terminal domain-containing protein [Bacillus sp. EB600]|nr:DnaB-like helicase C-terminal domain-containing protein [Bacillus sp. EB600]